MKPKFIGETMVKFKRLAAAGASAKEIATACNTTVGVVYVIASRKGIRLVNRRGRHLAANVAGDVGAAFDMRAQRVGVQTAVLVRRVLSTIAHDDLFDAILDSADADDRKQEQTTNV